MDRNHFLSGLAGGLLSAVVVAGVLSLWHGYHARKQAESIAKIMDETADLMLPFTKPE